MRRSAHLLCLVVLLSGFLATSTAAQTSVQTGAIAAGGNLGVFFPDEAFEKTLAIEGYGEYYATPNLSVRGLFGWARPGFENVTEDHFRQVKLLFNGIYYFRRQNWLPYVTAGAGAYFVRELFEDAPDPDSETRGGINFGVGTEYSLGDGASVRGELRWEFVSEPNESPDASGVSLMFGYKRYF
jgi:opacity protein-like surface antigen